MKKRKIVLGLAMAAMAVFTLSGCQDDSTTNPIVNAENGNNSENGNQTGTTSGNITSGTENQSGTGATNGGNENQSGTGVTNGGNENQSGTGGSTTTGGDNGGQGQQGGQEQPSENKTEEGKSQAETGLSNTDSNGQFTNVAGKIQLTKAYGDLEACYVTYNEYSNASLYNAYVKKEGDSTYTKLDSRLTRKYRDGSNTYIRTDAVGLKAGKYSLKVVPVVNNAEVDNAAAVADITVVAHIRDGFGFVGGSSSGAYNDDGTLKSNADIVYVSNSNKDTVSLKTVDKKGKETTVTGIQNIITNLKGNTKTNPLCIRVLGNITDPSVLIKGDLYIDTATVGLTVEGIGNDATMNGFGLVLKNSSNVEIRNLAFMNCNSSEGDDCGLQQANNHVWVHNCDFFYGDAGSDSDQAKGDGALDTKKSSYVTHSYNHFFDNGKSNLQGMKDETTENYVTYHHNWYDHSDSRHPRVRTCTVHVYNNYFDGNAKYGIGNAMGASIFAENNYFRSTSGMIPFITGQMAHDIQDDGGRTLSKEYGGVIKEYGNVFDGTFRYTKYTDNNTDFDAYNASSRSEIVPSSVKSPASVPYNNFDTASTMYAYTLHTAQDAKVSVVKYAGRIDGGDFHWTFNNSVDDASYAVNKELKQALTNYSSKLVSVQGI